MVEQVLVPGVRMRRGEASEPHEQDVHVQEGDLGPVVEGRDEAEGFFFGKGSC